MLGAANAVGIPVTNIRTIVKWAIYCSGNGDIVPLYNSPLVGGFLLFRGILKEISDSDDVLGVSGDYTVHSTDRPLLNLALTLLRNEITIG
jgi:hypothetical protein